MCGDTTTRQRQAQESENPNPFALDQMHFKETGTIGHPLLTPKPRNTFRLYMQNLHGISVGDSGDMPKPLQDLKAAHQSLPHLN